LNYREWQSSLREKIIFQLKNNKVVLLQAPTGSGKTLFALDVAFSVGNKILVAVRTHNEFYPFYREIANRFHGKRYAFLIGRSNGCLIASEKVKAEDITCSGCEFLTWKKIDFYGSPFETLAKLKKEGVNEKFCPYHSILNSALDADVILVTYPYLFIPSLRDTIGISLDDYVVIVDEAHNVDSLIDLEERRLSPNSINMAIKQSFGLEVKQILEKLKAKVVEITFKEKKFIALSKEKVESLLLKDELDAIEEEASYLSQRMITQRKIVTNHLMSIVKFFNSVKEDRFRVFSSENSIIAKPVTSDQYMSIFNGSNVKAIFMSGTLQPKEYFSTVLGLSKDTFYVDVEKEVGKVGGSYECFIALDVTSSYSLRSEEMNKRFASYLLRIYYQAKGHILAVFPSYEMIEKVSLYLRSVNTFTETPITKVDDLIEHARNTPKIMIMATARGKLSEGIEISQNGRSLINDVAIVGIPYPPLDDYMKARSEEVSKRTRRNYLEELMQMPAYIAVRQAIGRSIRSPEDKSEVWLLDKRFNNMWWKKNIKCFNPKLVRL